MSGFSDIFPPCLLGFSRKELKQENHKLGGTFLQFRYSFIHRKFETTPPPSGTPNGSGGVRRGGVFSIQKKNGLRR